MFSSFLPEKQVLLASKTTLELGGRAQYFLEVDSEQMVIQATSFCMNKGIPLTILGGGSNVVISDAGISGLVLCMRQRGIEHIQQQGQVFITAQAGEPWDRFVAYTVEHKFAGLECLSGIPGLCGATPIQNVGAYGQEVADTITEIRVLDRETLSVFSIPKEDCSFGYRTSLFKRYPQKYVVLSVTFALDPQGIPHLRYPELKQAIRTPTQSLSLKEVRDAVLHLRRLKSMVLDPEDENRRSVGSFFLNPILPKKKIQEIIQNAIAQGIIHDEGEMPQYLMHGTHGKLSAAWLIEKSGIHKGQQFGSFAISSKHSLCLIHRGEGTAAGLVRAAIWIQRTVLDRFQIWLQPEPNFLGFSTAELADLFHNPGDSR